MKQKETRFEKVVEWEKEPQRYKIVWVIILFILGIGGLIGIGFDKNIFKLEAMFLTILYTLILIFVAILLNCSLGKDRKVYWRKIQ